jgi:hypothetical protein
MDEGAESTDRGTICRASPARARGRHATRHAGSGQVTIDLGKGDPLQYIYNTGYLFKTGGTAWNPISYTSAESLIANAWYPKTANATIAKTSAELPTRVTY